MISLKISENTHSLHLHLFFTEYDSKISLRNQLIIITNFFERDLFLVLYLLDIFLIFIIKIIIIIYLLKVLFINNNKLLILFKRAHK